MKTGTQLKSIKLITLCLIYFTAFLFIGMYFLLVKESETSDTAAWGQSGDWIGGTIGTIIAGVTVYFVWQTFSLQRRALKKSKKELKMTRDFLHKQQFESTFFNMMAMINTLQKDISYPDHTHFAGILTGRLIEDNGEKAYTGAYFFRYISKLLWNLYRKNNQGEITPRIAQSQIIKDYLAERIEEMDSEMSIIDKETHRFDESKLNAWLNDNEKSYCGLLYEFVFENTHTQIAHYFRYIYRTMRFAVEAKSEIIDPHNYIGLIQAQLSNHQLAVMYYSGLSEVSKNAKGKPKFWKWADKYGLFQNIEPEYLMDGKEHCRFYPRTEFKCLGNKTYSKWKEENEGISSL